MTAAERLAAIRAREQQLPSWLLVRRDVRRMADALAAVLALPLPDEVDDFTAGYASGVMAAWRAITDALGGAE